MQKERSAEQQSIYELYKKGLPQGFCPFCEKELLIEAFDHWLILKNRFPYDLKAKRHDLLLPIRHVTFYEELDFAERFELSRLKTLISQNRVSDYDYFRENLVPFRSIPNHYHIHLIKEY